MSASASPTAPVRDPARAPARARLLAIDSSTERLCLAIDDGERRRWRHETEGGPQASTQLLPLLLQGLDELGLPLTEVDAVGFARGPGAFTGLRTACSVAQGLALGAGKPVLAIDSLAIVAQDAWVQVGAPASTPAAGAAPSPFMVWVAMDARMDEVYAAQYQRETDGWRVLTAPALYTLEALDACWQAAPPAVVAGSALDAFAQRLPTGNAQRVSGEQCRADALMALAQAAWSRGEAFDPALALPLYLRDKVALTTAEREARAAAAANAAHSPAQGAAAP